MRYPKPHTVFNCALVVYDKALVLASILFKSRGIRGMPAAAPVYKALTG